MILNAFEAKTDKRFWAKLGSVRESGWNVKVIDKSESWLMRCIYYGLGMPLWCPWFMADAATTICNRVYMPTQWIGTRFGYWAFRHELVHVEQWRRLGVMFWVLYLLPFPVGPLNLRWWFELEAYREQMRAIAEDHVLTRGRVDGIIGLFLSSGYLWMLPFPSLVRRIIFADADRFVREAKRSAT